ncbi:unnamed protein product [Somion occarium]|uniref:Fungal-type protein kinase domain-containing protein n=1 Tax=Somion occarium TaxID=3059160 RepID=A0ABP1DLV4_9APHY
MIGLFVGPMPPRGFLEAFMRLKILRKLNPEDLPEVDFSEIPLKKLEVEMYQPLCDAINDSGVCSGFKLIDVSSSVDGNGIPLRPDLAFVPTDAEDLMDYTVMEFFVEAKVHDLADPFHGNTLNNTIEKMVGESAETRGQTISYAAALLSRQHRTFAFSIVVCGKYARFLRWDRAGCIVSDRFDYVEEPDILLEFFWCYARLTREERGFDPTVVPASAAEAKLLSDTLSRYIKESQPRNVSYLQPKPDSTYPFSKMLVPTPNGTRELIVGKPFWDADSPCGRATRAYAAYDMVEKKIVFAKDSWRDKDEDSLSEAVIYDTLQKSNVPFLPEVIAAGDVYVKIKKRKMSQRTLTRKWAVRSGKAVLWRLPCAEMRTLVHCRVVQQLAYPLTSARSSKEAAQAIRDAIEAIKVAYHDGKIFHRDISTGNIMISQSGRGILNDWDHGLRVILRNTPKAYRTGTWQFISILLLQNPKKGHDVHDDLESSFWVLLYVSLHYFPHNLGPTFNVRFFDECSEEQDINAGDGQTRELGGAGKTSFLSHKLKVVEWRCVPLNSLIHSFGELLTDYQYYYEKMDRNNNKDAEAQFKAIQEQLEKVDTVLGLFDTALASDEWPEDDAVPDQFPLKTKKQEDRMIHGLKSRAIATAALERQAAASRTAPPTRSAIPGIRSSARLVQQRNEQQDLAPEAGPSRLPIPMSSRSTVKRTLDEVPVELPVFRSKRAKTAPERRPLKRAPKPPPPERPVVEHRYPTRSKSNGSRRGNSLKKPQEEDVEMQDVRRRNASRSRTKSKSKDTRRVQATASEKSTVEKQQARRKGKQSVKSTAGNGSRSPPKSSTRRRK